MVETEIVHSYNINNCDCAIGCKLMVHAYELVHSLSAQLFSQNCLC